jgi:hypothetical protein
MMVNFVSHYIIFFVCFLKNKRLTLWYSLIYETTTKSRMSIILSNSALTSIHYIFLFEEEKNEEESSEYHKSQIQSIFKKN